MASGDIGGGKCSWWSNGSWNIVSLKPSLEQLCNCVSLHDLKHKKRIWDKKASPLTTGHFFFFLPWKKIIDFYPGTSGSCSCPPRFIARETEAQGDCAARRSVT